MTITAETAEALYEVRQSWKRAQATCDHRNSARDDEGQGEICEHEDNESGMEWCSPSYCPLLAI